MSRCIVKNYVTCGSVICGYPRCLTEIHKLRIQQIPVCHVNPQMRLRHRWTVPCSNDFLTQMSQSVCVWYILGPSIQIPTSLQDTRFAQNCCWGYRFSLSLSPWSRGPWTHQHRVIPKRHACYNSCLPLLPQSSTGVSFLTACCLSHSQSSM